MSLYLQVAAFHSLVGLAAMAGAAGEFFASSSDLAAGTMAAIYLATFIGGVTFVSWRTVCYDVHTALLQLIPLTHTSRVSSHSPARLWPLVSWLK